MQHRDGAGGSRVKDTQARPARERADGQVRWPVRLWRRWGIDAEELVNALSHGVGAVLALAGLVVLLWQSVSYADAAHTAAVSVYGVSLVAVFAASTLYHATTSERLKPVFLWLDHSCIYALIAGTYTPFMLTVLRGWLGTAVLCTVWGLGILGVLSKTVLKIRSDLVSIPFYLGMGWLIVVVIEPFTRLMETEGVLLLLAGGLCFSLGVVFFLLRLAYAHAAWHVMVLAGAVLHYCAVLLYARPN
jgi:hemolysin III